MIETHQQDALNFEKTLWVKRSQQSPDLLWWSLPFSLQSFRTTLAPALSPGPLLVHPATAISKAPIKGQIHAGDTFQVTDSMAFFQAHEAGQVADCKIVFLSPTCTDNEIAEHAGRMAAHLDEIPFTLAAVPDAIHKGRLCYAFRQPGQVVEVLEYLAFGRRFGTESAQVEEHLVRAMQLKPNKALRLRLAVGPQGAVLSNRSRAGCRRIHYLESGKGYTGTRHDVSWRVVLKERVVEFCGRFPVGVTMLAGLPFFIQVFLLQGRFARRKTRR